MTDIKSKIKAAAAASQRVEERKWWFDALSGLPLKTHFPYDRQNGGQDEEYHPATVAIDFPDDLSAGLIKLSNGDFHTLHVVLTAGVVLLLNKYQYSPAGDIITGTPIYRQSTDAELINTVLPLRIRLTGGMSFKDLLIALRQTVKGAVAHQNYPFEILMEQLRHPLTDGRCPLFDVGILLENIQEKSYLSPVRLNTLFYFHETGGELEGIIEYNTHLFSGSMVKNIARHFIFIMQTVLKRINEPLDTVILLGEDEKKQVLENFNNLQNHGSLSCDPSQTIHSRFQEQALKTPDAVAVIGPVRTRITASTFVPAALTYRELNRRADVLSMLLKEKGAGPDSVIALMMDRSIQLIVAVLAILKSGAAYLPIDPEYPQERIDYMLADSNAKLILSDAPPPENRSDKSVTFPFPTPGFASIYITRKQDEQQNTDCLKICSDSEHHHGQLVYIIYTSGSTGRPKGVMLEHRNLVNLMEYQFRYTAIDFSRVLQFTTISFDVSFQEIFSTLLSGGTLYITDAETRRDIPLLFRFIREQCIKTLFLPVSFLKFVFNRDEYRDSWPGQVSHIVTAGEQLVIGHLFRTYLDENNITVHNHYGPSESHVVTAFTMPPGSEKPELPSIGKPVLNTLIRIVDHQLNPMPVGIPGELLIGGIQVARGYLNNPDLTREKFLDADLPEGGGALNHKGQFNESFPLTPRTLSTSSGNGAHDNKQDRRAQHEGTKHRAPTDYETHASTFYKTGDLARWLPDGNIEFLGRKDEQVKIRGFRIELGEIETHLMSLNEVEDAVVIAQGDDEKYLCAYIVPAGSAPGDEGPARADSKALKEKLSERLPEYMVPAYIIPLKTIPLTPNRKIDRKALPDPEISATSSYVAPVTPLQKTMVQTWSVVLDVKADQIGIDDSFFQLGGHSLKATVVLSRLKKSIGADVLLADMFRFPTIRLLSAHIEASGATVVAVIEPVEKKEYYPLSPAQKRLFILQQMDKTITSYNMPTIMIMTGQMERERFHSAFRRLIERHESFRTSFITIGEEPVQRVHEADDIDFTLRYYDHSDGNVEPGATESTIYDFVQPFDFAHAPLFRAGLVKTGENEHILLFDMHHVLTDGTSRGVMIREFMSIYSGKRLEPLHLQYKDYSLWMRSELQEKALKKQESYWLERFAGEIPTLPLPYDFPRPEVQSFEGNRVGFVMDKKDADGLRRLADRIEGSLFMVVSAVYDVLLWRLSGREDILFGTPIAARRHADLEPIIGMFVNTLVMRSRPAGDMPFKEFLELVKRDTLDAFENQEYPFEELVEKVNVTRDAGRNPLFDVMFALQNFEMPAVEIQDLQLKPYPRENKTSKFDLNLDAIEMKGDSIYFSLEYSTRLFKEETARRFIEYFKRIARKVSSQPFTILSNIDIIGHAEKQEILEMSNGPDTISPYRTIHKWFEVQAIKNPDAIAVQSHVRPQFIATASTPKVLTYRQLNDRSNQMAEKLRNLGAYPDAIIALIMDRSPDLITAILAILKSGAAYLPIDPEYPRDRIDYILSDSNAKIILSDNPELASPKDGYTSSPFTFSNESIPAIYITHEPFDNQNIDSGAPRLASRQQTHGNSQGNLLYVIYTSGSTGRPKGVMLEHRNLINLMEYQFRHTAIDFSRVLQFTTISFDVSFQEIFSALLSGGTLYIADQETRQDIPQLFRFVDRHEIRTLFLPSSFAKFVFNRDDYARDLPQSVKHIVTAGERLVVGNHFRSYLRDNKITLHNHYGPTESHVVTAYAMPPDKEIPELPSIGKPVANTRILIVDKHGKLQPIGVPGELLIRGIQVARGYLNNPELTYVKYAETTAPRDESRDNKQNRIAQQEGATYGASTSDELPAMSLYKTGDLARWLADGNIEFLGRMDEQVKIRGFRIELGEIESRLMELDSVKEAVVITRSTREGESGAVMDDKYLCAYVVSSESDGIGLDVWRRHVAETLPDYMVPSYFVPMKNIPLTANRKVDRKALPEPKIETSGPVSSPRNDVEKTLVRLWAELLEQDVEQIGIDDDFFRIGGHSLKAMVFISRLIKALGIEIRLVEMFNKPTIRQLAQLLEGKEKSDHAAIPLAEKKEYYPLSPSQKRLYILQQMEPANTSYNMPAVMILEGGLDKNHFQQVFRRLIERHEAFRTSFVTINGEPGQRIYEPNQIDFAIDYFPPEQIEQKVIEWVKPFDLSAAPLLRVGLSPKGTDEHLFLLDMHHTVCDGTSLGILIGDFMALYAGKALPPLNIHYKDFSQWMNGFIKQKSLLRQEDFWKNRFTGEIPVLTLPYDFPRPAFQGFAGNRHGFIVDEVTAKGLKAVCQNLDASLFIVLLSAYNIWLWKLSGQEDIVVGTPVASRRHTDLENILGMFVNTLALRHFPAGEKTVSSFIREVKEHTVEAFDNQEYPFEALVDHIKIPRDAGRNPLFDVMLSLRNFDIPEVKIEGLRIKPFRHENKTAKFDLNLDAIETENNLLFSLEYSTDLFKSQTIETFTAYFKRILQQAAADPSIFLKDIEILDEAEKQELIQLSNGPGIPFSHQTIHALFEVQAQKKPEAIAVQSAVGKQFIASTSVPGALTYRRLNDRANQIAAKLKELGVYPGSIVGLMTDPSIHMIAAMLGILKAGAAYMPIDPELPENRIDYMLADSNSKIILSDNPEPLNRADNTTTFSFSFTDESTPDVYITHNPNEQIDRNGNTDRQRTGPGGESANESILYVIYTSGSTGRPKGVMLEHRNLVNLLQYQYRHTDIDFSRVMQFTTISFDVSFQEIFSTLLAGGTLYLIDKELKQNIEGLMEVIENHAIGTLFLPASFLKFVLGNTGTIENIPGSVRHIVTAGEQVMVTPGFRRILQEKQITLHNHYGPSESHVVTTFSMPPNSQIPDLPPIGRPVSNTAIHIVDKHGNLQPTGVPGELIISGIQVARGYLNMPELTREKFATTGLHSIPVTEPGEQDIADRLYRTGDLAKWLPNGNIEFLGRIDQQVKIRGYRIELEEIEHHIMTVEKIKEAVVTIRKNSRSESYLCAYFVSGETVNISSLRQDLKKRLPDYMMPSRFMQIDAVPLSPTKKVDRAALPEPETQRPEIDAPFLAPASQIEKIMVDTWIEVLQVDKIGVHDNFFDLGGNSLRMIKVNNLLNQRLNKKIPVMLMFKHPTIHELARNIEEEKEKAAVRAEQKAYKETLDKGKNRMKKTANMRKKMKR